MSSSVIITIQFTSSAFDHPFLSKGEIRKVKEKHTFNYIIVTRLFITLYVLGT